MKRRLARLVRKAQRALAPQAPLSGAEHARNGDLARNSGDWSTARDHYVLAVSARPDLEAIWVQLGHAYKTIGQFTEAEKAYRAALKLNENNADTWLQLGHLLKSLERPEEALDAYEDAFRLEPLNAHAEREVFSLRGHVVRPRPRMPAAMVEVSKPQYADELLSPARHIILDLTGARDHGPGIFDEMAQICGRMVGPDGRTATAVLWNAATRGWDALDGSAIAEASLAHSIFLLAGPGISADGDYIEALRHLTLHQGAPLISVFLDQEVFFRPDLYTQEQINGARNFLELHRTLASAALSAMGTDLGRLRELVGQATPQIGALPLPSGSKSAKWLPSGPIAVFGVENTSESAALRSELATIGVEMRDCVHSSEPTAEADCIDIRGAVFLSADVHSLSIAAACLAAGIPRAFARRPGFDRLVDWADAILPAEDSVALKTSLAMFAKTAGLGARHVALPDQASIPCSGLFGGWRRRIPGGPTAISQLVEFGSPAVGSLPTFSSSTLFPGAWTAEECKGVRILGDVIELGHNPQQVNGRGETVALLISAPSSSISVCVSVSCGAENPATVIDAGSLAWVHCPLVPGANTARLAVRIACNDAASSSDKAILHAIFSYPTGRPDVWWDFLDQIARGKHPSIRQLTRSFLMTPGEAVT